jgi:hypothetical protein
MAGTAQETVLDATRLMVISHNHTGCVDACGVGVHRARRIESDEGALARAQESVVDNLRVSIDPRNYSRRVDVCRPGVRRARNFDRS